MDDRIPCNVYLPADRNLRAPEDSRFDESPVQRGCWSRFRAGGGNGRLYQSRVEAMSAEEKQDATFSVAKQLYAEQFGDAIVTNTYLKLALLAMALVSAGLLYANVRTVRMVENVHALVLRVNDLGR